MTSYDSGGSYHRVVAVEAVLGAAVVVVAVPRTSRLRRHLVPKRAVGDKMVRRLALVAAFRERAMGALGRYVVGKIPAVVTPATRGTKQTRR